MDRAVIHTGNEEGSRHSAAISQPSVLAVRNLGVTFRQRQGSIRAVEDVSFTIAAGETLALVGESGSGKSVTSLALMRLLAPEAEMRGEITLANADGTGARDLLTLPRRELRRLRGMELAMIFQEPMTSLNPVHRVGGQIAEVMKLHHFVPREDIGDMVIRLLDEVGIPDPQTRISSYPHELSGGMRQRVMIALALACQPRLLIADEPTTALDVTVQAQIIDLLARLQATRNTAMLFITHDLALVSGVADRVAVMYSGQILETAAAADLFSNPRHPYTRALLRSSPKLGQRRAESPMHPIRGLSPTPGDVIHGCRFGPRCDHFKEGTCDTTVPPMEAISLTHQVRCVRWREIGAQL